MIGIRREDKNRWERRAPLTPDHVAELARGGIDVAVEPSPIRVFSDEAYRRAGARLRDDLSPCPLIVGVKEIPPAKLHRGTAYAFFAHVTKGQPANMPMLRGLMERGCTLVDYEKVVDDRGRRILFFGRHAGYAGMLDTLWALGRRLAAEGIDTPFGALQPAHRYADLEEAHVAIGRVASAIRREGIPDRLHPVVFGFTGSGNTSRGAQEVFEHLPHEEILPEDLAEQVRQGELPRNLVYKVAFSREDRFGDGVRRNLPHLTVLVNGVYWEPGQPRVVTLADLRDLWGAPAGPRLRVVGDISCDVMGSIEATVHATTPGDPVFVYDVASGEALRGVAGRGPVVLAVDNLPCELPVDASAYFADALLRFVPPMARCDWSRPLHDLGLPPEIARAVIVHRGCLAPDYAYLEPHVAAAQAPRR
jgi:alpha-aminoadipic semialdehyde synthase